MALDNPWVGYLQRSYLQIKNSLLNTLGNTVPEVTDHSESNILVIIISMFSGVAEMLNYYIDNMAREAFITTARRYSSVVKHTRLIDYRIKAMIGSSVDVDVFLLDSNDEPFENDVEFTIPMGSIFKTDNNINFVSIQDIVVPIGVSVINIPLEQKTLKVGMSLGTTDGSDDQLVLIGSNYLHDSITLYVDGEPWELQNTLGRSEPEDKHFIVEISADKKAYIRFGDNVNGLRPAAGQALTADYYESQGVLGNVNSDTIKQTEFDFSSTGSGFTSVNITNAYPAVAGTNFEDIARIRRSAPLSLRTLDRAVTRQDYEDIAKLAPGVDKAKVLFTCGKYVTIYISPNGGGIAQQTLLQSAKEYIDERKMITTFIKTLPAGETYLKLKITATAKFRRNPVLTKDDIIEALTTRYSYDNSDINMPIRKSDIIALIDNLEKVDYLTLEYIYATPYIRPVDHLVNLLHNIQVNPGSNSIINWKIIYDGNFMRLIKNGVHIANLVIGDPYTEPNNVFTLTINNGPYQIGYSWEFKTFPYNENIELSDYTVPIIKESNLDIEVIEQISIN